jgi:dihydrolipoamide dehydrogenase
MKNTEQFDIVIIGGGPAGYAAAMRAIDFGKKVCLIERSRIGGAGITDGALSSKTLWEVSNKVVGINDTIVNEGRDAYEVSWDTIQHTVEEAKLERKLQYSMHLKLLQDNTLNQQLWLEKGEASFINEHEIKIISENNEKIVYGDNIIIATGSRPRLLPQYAIDERFLLTSDGIEHIDDYPESLVIVGAGVIGCEYATIFANFGKTKVHLIDRQSRILPYEDDDVSDLVAKNLEKRGVVIHHNATLERMEVIDNEVEYELSYPNKPNEIIRVKKALFSIGRTPNIESLNLETAGVTLNDRGVIEANDTQTKTPHIYAVGDVTGGIALVNMGEIEGRHAVERIMNPSLPKLNTDNICTIMFLQPEVALVGMNEQECAEKNIPIKVVKIQFSLIARAIAMRKTEGFFKIIVTNDDEMRILGMRACGEHASTAIQAVGLLIKMNEPIEVLSELIHPHPSIVEGIQECVRMLLNRSIFKSNVFKDKLACYSLVDGVKTNLETGIQCII